MTPVGTQPLQRTRCLQHSQREAVGRCPVCGHFFCRECLIEHDGRLTCSRCLAERISAEGPQKSGSRIRGALAWGLALLSLWLGWGFFMIVGRILLFLRHDWKEIVW